MFSKGRPAENKLYTLHMLYLEKGKDYKYLLYHILPVFPLGELVNR